VLTIDETDWDLFWLRWCDEHLVPTCDIADCGLPADSCRHTSNRPDVGKFSAGKGPVADGVKLPASTAGWHTVKKRRGKFRK
jgi:hypothetical protein